MAYDLPTIPLPPTRLLTVTGTGTSFWSSITFTICRTMMSVPPPGAYGTTISIGRTG